MARRHHDPVVVRGSVLAVTDVAEVAAHGPDRPGQNDSDQPHPDQPAPDPHDLAPRDFVWRGRRYTVCAVLSSWQERRAWWREVGDDPSGPPSPQRRVWRVEARPPIGDVGVFDLGRDDDHWLLLRAHD